MQSTEQTEAIQADLDFSQLIMGFCSAALLYLGESPAPNKEQGEVHLPLAKHNIDVLMLLKEKTHGNLCADEEHLMNELLADLQLKYATAKASASAVTEDGEHEDTEN